MNRRARLGSKKGLAEPVRPGNVEDLETTWNEPQGIGSNYVKAGERYVRLRNQLKVGLVGISCRVGHDLPSAGKD
ncbi:hypothetical protein Scep_012174 [Stephania cephalantha]|uniref:Uncharacterized protein n=1 Tax=Stephania cephalantha TaxID=152367 RepID=A0AAP0JG33_9MAGN